jgi:hypothetical protein
MGTESDNHAHSTLGRASQGQKPLSNSPAPNKAGGQQASPAPQQPPSPGKKSEGPGQEKVSGEDGKHASQNRSGHTQSR